MVNNLLGVWNTVGSVLLAILILLAMITIHEFGHYLAGKALKFKINEFSIGFGPALFKHTSKKSGELFAVRLIPLGGYCAFEGEDGLEPEEPEPPEPFEETAEPPAEEKDVSVPAEGTERVLLTEPKAPEGELPEEGAEDFSEAAEEISAPPEGAAPSDAAPEIPPETDGAFTHKKPWQRIIVLVSGAFMNYILALIFLIALIGGYGQTMIAVYTAAPQGDIPAEYCLRDRDILLEAEGRKLYLTTDLAKAVNGKKAGDLVRFRLSRIVGTEGEGEEKKSIREEIEADIMLREDVSVKNSADLDCVYRALGFLYEEGEGEEAGYYSVASASYRFGFFETIGRSFTYSVRIAGSIFRVLGELLTGKLGLNALGGPVSTITLTSKIAGQSFRGFLEIAGFIGVNLAVFNLLPIPALDGSKVVFTLIEWIFRRPVPRKIEAVIHAVGFVLLLGFAVLVDILQFV